MIIGILAAYVLAVLVTFRYTWRAFSRDTWTDSDDVALVTVLALMLVPAWLFIATEYLEGHKFVALVDRLTGVKR